jgi:hypothetical protein
VRCHSNRGQFHAVRHRSPAGHARLIRTKREENGGRQHHRQDNTLQDWQKKNGRSGNNEPMIADIPTTSAVRTASRRETG